MNNKENIVKLLQAISNNLGEERIMPDVYNLLEIVVESDLVSGFTPIKAMGQSHTQYKAISPNLTLRGIEYLEINK